MREYQRNNYSHSFDIFGFFIFILILIFIFILICTKCPNEQMCFFFFHTFHTYFDFELTTLRSVDISIIIIARVRVRVRVRIVNVVCFNSKNEGKKNYFQHLLWRYFYIYSVIRTKAGKRRIKKGKPVWFIHKQKIQTSSIVRCRFGILKCDTVACWQQCEE